MSLSRLQSEVEASKLLELQTILLSLDAEYLRECLREMERDHSKRETLAVLDPSPFTHGPRQDLYAAQIKQLELYVQAAENMQTIQQAQMKLKAIKESASALGGMFGL